MLKKLFTGFMLLALLSGLLAAVPAAPVAAQAGDGGLAPDAFLDPDGTLNLDGRTSGALDLSGYSVQIDPQLGPIFTPLAPQNEWDSVGSGGGAFQQYINTVIMVGTNVYVSGGFQDAAGIPEADFIAHWDGTQWLALSSNGSGDGALWGAVNAMYYTGGFLYVGGNFTDVYNTSGLSIANATHFARWNGSAWSAVPGITSALAENVKDFAYYSGTNVLYIAGEFTNVNSNGAADYLFGIDLDNDTLVTFGGNGFGDGALTSGVITIAVDSTGILYAGGFFVDIHDGLVTLFEADFIAKWDGSNWSALGNNGLGVGALNSLVVEIALDASDDIYVGGWFTNVAGIPEADSIAKWDGSNWSALGNNGAGDGALLSIGGGATIQSIAVSGTDVYVGGYFIGSSGIPTADYIARFNTLDGTWSGLGSDGAGNGAVKGAPYDMLMNGGLLYVVGDFYDVSNTGTVMPTADYFAVWNGSTWSTHGESNGLFGGSINAMAMVGTDVYVGGEFVDAGGDPRMDYLIRWDGSQWNPVGNLAQTYGSLNAPVNSLAVDGTDLYIGGFFTFVYNNGSTVANSSRIVKWDGSTFTSVGGGLNNAVWALAVDASHNLYAGGFFTNAGSMTEADYIAKWNGSAWSALAGNGSGNGAVNAMVRTLALRGTDLLIGGSFTSVVNPSNVSIANTAYLAKWTGSAWSAMDGVTQPLGSIVYALAFSGSDVYVGGDFTNFNGITAADKIAHWNGSAWSSLGSNGLGDGSLVGSINAIAVNGTDVYVGGNFTDPVNVDNVTLTAGDYVARWNGSNWSALASNGSAGGSINGIVMSLMIKDDDLWVGGQFQNVNNSGTVVREADHLAAFGLDLAPQVVSIACASACATSALNVDFTVTFSEAMLNVDTADFELVATGVTGASITGVSGSGATRTVTVNTGTGNGTLHIDIPVTATLNDINNNVLGGLPYSNGQTYTVQKKLILRSTGAEDGWILESGETTNVGGTMDSAATTLRLGDHATKRQYRSILSFATGAGLPDNAVITKVILKVKQQGIVGGGNPVSAFQGFIVGLRKGVFGTAALELTDWGAIPNKNLGPFNASPVSGWYSLNLTLGKDAINKLATGGGLTQIRLSFKIDDDNNATANYLSLYSGDYSTVPPRPTLIVVYYTP